MSGDPMTDPTDRRPSYEPGRRWSAGFHVVVGVVALFAIVVMVNYLAATRMRWRYDWSSAQRPQLSPLTVATLGGLTNEVKAVVLFDPASDLYRHVKGLLREYALQSPRISVQLVDYVLDATLATAIKSRYGLGGFGHQNILKHYGASVHDWFIYGCCRLRKCRHVYIARHYR